MEELNKSIDELIDGLLLEETVVVEGEAVEKSMAQDIKPDTKADAALKAVPKSENDEDRDAGRPKQISDVPEVDTDGERSGEYDAKIAKKNEDAKKKEDSQVKAPDQMKKSLSDAEFAEYEALKKAETDRKTEETLQKARQETSDLIKSAVSEAVTAVKAENNDLRKAIDEQGALIKAMANRPKQSKAITGMQAVEKFQKSEGSANLSKSEVLDVAEELVKSGKLTMDSCIELENSGFIYEPEARGVLEREIKRRYQG